MTRKPDFPGICLNMIVRDEAAVIERAIRSVAPFISCYAICDTGSLDLTIEIIERVMAELEIPGKVFRDVWQDFGHNRTMAIKYGTTISREYGAKYLMFFDADEQVTHNTVDQPDPDWAWKGYSDWFKVDQAKKAIIAFDQFDSQGLKKQGLISTKFGNIVYRRPFLAEVDSIGTNAANSWHWKGVRHEYLTGGRHYNLHIGDNIHLWVNTDGARSKNPKKFLSDAVALANDLKKNPGDPRTTYYLAQSWRDAGEMSKAAEIFMKRALMEEGWKEERFMAALHAGRCYKALNKDKLMFASFQLAISIDPNRMEPFVEMAQFYRWRQEWELARVWARTAHFAVMEGTAASGGLFWAIEDHSYLPTELYYLTLFYTNQKRQAWEVLSEFLTMCIDGHEVCRHVSRETVERLQANEKFHK